jgi:hypothetical protein
MNAEISIPEETPEEAAALEVERQKMRNAIANMTFAWAEVENAMVLVLTSIVNQGPTGDIASAIFFAVDSLDARIAITNNAFRSLFGRIPNVDEIIIRWQSLIKTTKSLKAMRNKSAHGQMTTILWHNGKRYVRLTKPLSNHDEMRLAIESNKIPGYSYNDINISAHTARNLVPEYRVFSSIVSSTTIFSSFYSLLPKKIAELEALRPSKLDIPDTQT